MHAPVNTPHRSRSPTPAIVLALALLGGLAAGAWMVVQQVRMVPGTTISAPTTPAQPQTNAPEIQKAGVAHSKDEGPGWETLNTPQKLALYPLAERWAFLGSLQKRRWLALAQTFPSLPEEEQARLHDRMTAWASLSAQQRNQARLNFAVTNRLSTEDKRSQWDAYQALSEEEKRKLAARANTKPQGAAPALRPSASKRLAKVPAAVNPAGNPANPPKIPPSSSAQARIAAPGVAAETRSPEAQSANAPASTAVPAPPVAPPPAEPPEPPTPDTRPSDIYLN
ncbi:MAG: DUF3106 domain-containing protein [Giesbergeria sp.]|nr:DUF3106 domain-containing protein [Comamonadaceae bacterium]